MCCVVGRGSPARAGHVNGLYAMAFFEAAPIGAVLLDKTLHFDRAKEARPVAVAVFSFSAFLEF